MRKSGARKHSAAFLERGNWREAIVVVMKVSEQDGCSIVALPPKPDGHLKRIWRPYETQPLEARIKNGLADLHERWPSFHSAPVSESSYGDAPSIAFGHFFRCEELGL